MRKVWTKEHFEKNLGKLKLPIIKIELEKPVLSMDNYVKFITFNLKHTNAGPKTRSQKLAQAINILFRLK